MQAIESIRIAVFQTFSQADRAVSLLLDAGLSQESISVMCSERSLEEIAGSGELPAEARVTRRTKESVAAGSTVGGVLGGLGTVAGLTLASGAAVLLAGPLLLGVATGGIVGGFVGAMASWGLEPEAAGRYEQALRDGRTLVAVDSVPGAEPGSLETAETILEQAGAESVVSIERGRS